MVPGFGAELFNFDVLAVTLMVVIGFIGLTVASFAARYMSGDRHYRRFFGQLAALMAAVAVMAAANHLVLLLLAWGAANALLVRMMVHKARWSAARASGALAGRTLLLGGTAIAGAFGLLYATTGSMAISTIVDQPLDSPAIRVALTLLLVGAMAQSALWPFHRWLTSSLNAPTPVSAIMHAGLVNGGGFLLLRFAPLYLDSPNILNAIFILGLLSALLGTAFKLIQNNVKRMLACSTMGQMGFMFVQCGLGLFPAAVAHLVGHACFKAYLFLASGSAAREKRLDLDYPPRLRSLLAALLCGLSGSYVFALSTGHPWLAADTSMFLVILTAVAGLQFSLPLLRERPLARLPLALAATGSIGAAYGLGLHFIEAQFATLQILQPQPLSLLHLVGAALLVAAWLAVLLFPRPGPASALPPWFLRLYVRVLNASQAHPDTVTAHRNHYAYR